MLAKCKWLLLLLLPLVSEAKILDVPRVHQETPAWCWLASSEMVIKANGGCVMDGELYYQDSMIKYLVISNLLPAACYSNPKLCPYPAGSFVSFKYVIDNYTADSSKKCGKALKTSMELAPPAKSKLAREINMGRPVIIGINQDGVRRQEPMHAVVIIGYKSGYVTLNDPYDYGDNDPWIKSLGALRVKEGVYTIKYEDLVDKTAWTTTIYMRKK